MPRLRITAAFFSILFSAHSSFGAGDDAATTTGQYDVVIYGGTASGVAAAVSAAREGSSVVLLEPTRHVGGMVTGGLSRSDFGNRKVIGGFAREFYTRLGKDYNTTAPDGMERFPEPHVAEAMLNTMLREAKVPVVLGTRLKENDGVTTGAGGVIKSIRMEDGTEYSGKIFADCSYEGDLMAQAGVTYTVGREAIAEYGESLAGVRDRTPIHQFMVNVKARDENGNLLPEIQDEPMGEVGSADKKVQAYNFRVIATQREDNRVPFPKPQKYDPARYELLARLLEVSMNQTGTTSAPIDLMRMDAIQGDKVDINNYGAFSTDYIGGNWDYPDGTYAEREAIWQDHYEYVAGFFYFLGNDPRVPKALRDEMNTWGLAKDEFTENDHWPRQLYVREGRRMLGDFVMTQHDIQTSRTKDDVVGMGSYQSDSHNVQRFENADGFAENEGDMQVPVKPYQIPYRVMLPKRTEAANLLVPVCMSASHVSFSTLRMEPQYMIIGQAAGVAAAMAAGANQAVQDVDTSALTKRLRELDAVMELESTR